MHRGKRILISGAGIAGPACAYWLTAYGYDVVIVERASSLRDGGQNVDIKGAGQQVIKMMGLAEAIEAKNTREQGQKYLDATGKVIATLPRGAFGTLTADFEILRGDFARVMFEATKHRCEYRFGRYIKDLNETSTGITASFDDGSVETFELVICAEGYSSATRTTILGAETTLHYLGAYMSFFKIPRRPGDDDWAYTVNGVGGTFITLRPGDDKDITALVTFPRQDKPDQWEDDTTRRRLLVQALEGRGTVAERILKDLDNVRDFYFGPMSQVRASIWSKGRYVMIGDAAYSPTPFTGEGTALGLVGAYVLAGELGRASTHTDAFAAYERLVRPYVERSQDRISPRLIRLIHVKSRAGIAMTRILQRLVASAPIQRVLRPNPQKREQAAANDFDFPVYRESIAIQKP